MIAWCGPGADGLGWLADRCRAVEEFKSATRLSEEAVDTLCNQLPRRLILSVENRVSYPALEIRHLQRTWPEIPWALAVGSWFDGARRTGLGTTHHLCLPWYRWWDGWVPWLRGNNAELLGPWPRALVECSEKASERVKLNGVILSNCRQTAEGWLAGLRADPSTTQLCMLNEFHDMFENWDVIPDWILWDDTCLNTFVGAAAVNKVAPLFVEVRERYPQVLIIAATCMPRWPDWQAWMAAGANELIVKPSQNILVQELIPASSGSSDK